MSEEKEKIVLVATHAGEDPERATFPFLVANAGLSMDMEAVVVLQGTAVFLAKKGYAEHVLAAGLTPLKNLVDSLLANGGKLLVCLPCIKERKIEETDLVEGSELITAGRLVVEMTSAKSTAVY